MISYLVVSAIIFYIWIHYWKHRKFTSLMKQHPMVGVSTLPFLGMAHHFLGTNESRMKSLQLFGTASYTSGGLAAQWLGPFPYIVVSDAEIADTILRECLEKDEIFKMLNFVIGDGLIIAPLSVWRSRRRVLVPAFITKHLRQFVNIFAKQSSIMVEQLSAKIGSGAFPIWNYLASNNMDTVAEAVFGIELNSQRDIEPRFLKAFAVTSSLMAERMTQVWLHSDLIYKRLPRYRKLKENRDILYETVDKVIETKLKEINEGPNNNPKSKVKPLLEHLLESSVLEHTSGVYTKQELREETMTLTIAGTDTSAAAVAFVVHSLAKHQDVQEKMYKELLDVFGSSDRLVEADDLKHLVYMEAVIKEAMRLYPPVPVVLRKLLKDIILPSGEIVPEGCRVLMNIWALHRNPKHWGPDAAEFRPERFLGEPMKHPAQYMPFSYGARNCPGNRYAMMSMQTNLATLLRRYRVLPAVEGDAPLRLSFEIMMKDADDFMVRLETRK